MRTKFNAFFVSLALVFALSASGFAADETIIMDFGGWDDAAIQSGGQLFEDICGDIDVLVTTFGTFDDTNGSARGFETVLSQSSSSSLRFRFSSPVEGLFVGVNTIDGNEIHRVYTSGNETYTHISGAMPTVTTDGGGISVAGNGYGLDPMTGAAFGTIDVDSPVFLATLTYNVLPNVPANLTKYGQWTMGCVVPVPEPNSVSLLGIGALGMLLQLRKKRK